MNNFSHWLGALAICANIGLAGCDGKEKQDAIAACDNLASDPHDPGRWKAGVPDSQVPVGAAIEACEHATRSNRNLPRSWFQLGRAYWLAKRDAEAFSAFVEAADQNYAPAKKYIGDAFLEGRGLPKQEKQDANTALKWYQESAKGGFEDAELAIKEIEKQRFNPSLFIRPEYISMMYEGNFNRLNSPLAFLIYLTAFNTEIGSQEVSFIAQDCTPLVTLGGNLALGGGSLMSAFKGIKNKEIKNDVWKTIVSTPLIADEGKRDAFTLFNTYGCKGRIAKTIFGNTNLSYAAIRKFLAELPSN